MVQFDEDQRVLDFLIDNGLASLKGQADVAVALGGLHPASNCAGTFFPAARLVKIIASHSKGLLHFHIWYTRDQSAFQCHAGANQGGHAHLPLRQVP